MKMKRASFVFVILAALFAAAVPASAATPFSRLITAGTSEYNDTAIVLQDGSGVLFQTSTPLVPADDDPFPGQRDVYLNKDGAITLLTPGLATSVSLDLVGASDDGSTFFVETTGALVAEDTDGSGTDVYEITGGQAFLVSTADTPNNQTNSQASFAGNTPDGKTVYYTTDIQMDLSDLDGGGLDVYAYTRTATGTKTQFISTSGAGDPQGNVEAVFCGASDNGNVVAFETPDELVGADNDGTGYDTYRYSGGNVTLASTGPDEPNVPGTQECRGVSGDGTAIAFESTVRLFAADDASNRRDVFTFNGLQTRWVSTSSNDVATDEHAFFGDMSWDGDTVYYNASDAMLAADTDSADVDGYSLGPSGAVTLLTGGDLEPDPGGARIFRVSTDGSTVLILTNDRFVAEDIDQQDSDVYARFNGAAPVLVSTGPVDLHGSQGNTPLFNSNQVLRKWTMSADGRIIAWTTNAPLTSNDVDIEFDVYAFVSPKDPPPSGGPGPAPDTSAPAISGIKLSNKTFAVDRKISSLVAAAKPKKGTKVSFTLSEAATVKLTFQSKSTGRAAGGKCVKETSKNRSAKKCTRLKTVATGKLAGTAGANAKKFGGRVGKRTLSEGSYQLIVSATDASGNSSSAKPVAFKIVS